MATAAQAVMRRRLRRRRGIRKRVSGSPARPRLSVFRSSANIYAQIVDDDQGHTLAAASSREADLRKGTKTEQARAVGQLLAQRARENGISQVVFDRGGFLYHGRIKAVADGAREGGLEF